MTATVQEIAEAIGKTISANAIATSGGQLRYQPYLADPFSPPIVLVAINTVEYHAAMARGNVPHAFVAWLILGRASDRAALEAMEAYMSASGESSIALAVETPDADGNRTLGGVVQDCICVKSGPPASLPVGTQGAEYIHVPFEVNVIA